MELKALLKELTNSVSIGHINDAREIIGRYLDFCQLENCGANGLVAKIDNNAKNTLLFDAHIDEVGMVVTDISHNGFVTVSNVGGIDLRQLPSKEVIIHGKQDISGVFVSTPPHLAKDNEKVPDGISKIKIDTGIGSKATDIISKGDFVTYKNTFLTLGNNRICAKSLDENTIYMI